ncbi:MAG: diguanylate cyclase [Candidatus Eremiobacteraeota bacterium]|nr:diguanylate cyclase [Candidatus Eremiobacteraeota bacterium]
MAKGLVLIADDDEPALDILQFLLQQWGYRVITAVDGKDAYEKVGIFKPDLILSDIMMPYMSGYELCNKIKTELKDYFIPIILLTAKTDLDSKLAGLNIGADDYLSKPYSHTELEARVRSLFRIKELHDELSSRNQDLLDLNQKLQYSLDENRKLQTELEEKNQQLLQLSRHDGLTNLYNRRTFYEFMNSELSRSQRYSIPLSVVMFDLDHFKDVNDTFGHLAGDFILRKFAKVLKKNSRQNDIITRYGGEEFIMLLPNTNCEQAEIVAERIRKEMETSTFSFDRFKINLTISCGVVEYRERDKDKENFLNAVDEELYKSKRRGRNCTSVRTVEENI